MSVTAAANAVAAAPGDPITLEVIRNRLQAIAREMSATIVRTAVSTVISEARDFSCTVFDGGGDLVCGAATVLFHFGVVGHAVARSRNHSMFSPAASIVFRSRWTSDRSRTPVRIS